MIRLSMRDISVSFRKCKKCGEPLQDEDDKLCDVCELEKKTNE